MSVLGISFRTTHRGAELEVWNWQPVSDLQCPELLEAFQSASRALSARKAQREKHERKRGVDNGQRARLVALPPTLLTYVLTFLPAPEVFESLPSVSRLFHQLARLPACYEAVNLVSRAPVAETARRLIENPSGFRLLKRIAFSGDDWAADARLRSALLQLPLVETVVVVHRDQYPPARNFAAEREAALQLLRAYPRLTDLSDGPCAVEALLATADRALPALRALRLPRMRYSSPSPDFVVSVRRLLCEKLAPASLSTLHVQGVWLPFPDLEAILQSQPAVTDLHLQGPDQYSPAQWARLAALCPRVRVFTVSEAYFDDYREPWDLSDWRGLEDLNVFVESCLPAALRLPASLRRLHSNVLPECHAATELRRTLLSGGLPRLREISCRSAMAAVMMGSSWVRECAELVRAAAAGPGVRVFRLPLSDLTFLPLNALVAGLSKGEEEEKEGGKEQKASESAAWQELYISLTARRHVYFPDFLSLPQRLRRLPALKTLRVRADAKVASDLASLLRTLGATESLRTLAVTVSLPGSLNRHTTEPKPEATDCPGYALAALPSLLLEGAFSSLRELSFVVLLQGPCPAPLGIVRSALERFLRASREGLPDRLPALRRFSLYWPGAEGIEEVEGRELEGMLEEVGVRTEILLRPPEEQP